MKVTVTQMSCTEVGVPFDTCFFRGTTYLYLKGHCHGILVSFYNAEIIVPASMEAEK